MPFASRRRTSPAVSIVSDWLAVAGVLLSYSGALHAASDGAQQLLDLCRTDALPADIRTSLEKRFTGWKLQEPADLGPPARERWAAGEPLTCPGIASGQFGSTRDVSYALLLVTPDHSSFRLVMFTQQSGAQFYAYKVVDRQDGDVTNYYLRTVAAKNYEGTSSKWGFHSPRPREVLLLVDSRVSAAATEAIFWADDDYQRQSLTP
jgi:hypothetical protein